MINELGKPGVPEGCTSHSPLSESQYPLPAIIPSYPKDAGPNIRGFVNSLNNRGPENIQEHTVPVPAKPKVPINIFKDHGLTYPCLTLSVFIQPDPAEPEEYARFVRMFARAGCQGAFMPEEADLVVFGGGSDVCPLLYGEQPHCLTSWDDKRDASDIELYLTCIKQGIPMLGVCRGAQFLHAMNEGKLYQHLENHYGNHSMWCLSNGVPGDKAEKIDRVSSTHHQACIKNVEGGMVLLAGHSTNTVRWLNNKDKIGPEQRLDVEAFTYPRTGCIGVQGHPEYAGYNKFQVWTLEKIEQFIHYNDDFEWQGRVKRMKKNLVTERGNLKVAQSIVKKYKAALKKYYSQEAK